MSAEPDAATRLRRALSPLLRTDEFHPLSSTVRVEYAAASHSGLGPDNNEDHYLVGRLSRTQTMLASSLSSAELPGDFEEYAYMMVVADGLGGKGSGGVASRLALSTLAHLALHFGRWNVRVDARTATEVMERAEWFYRRIHEVVRERGAGKSELSGMATSMTAAYTAGDELFVAHVGHSRAYLFRQGDLTLLTRDQTLTKRLAESGRPEPVQVGTEDLGHILTDAMGGHIPSPRIEVEHYRLLNGDCLLLCSDGLSDAVDHDRIAEVLMQRRNPNEQCQRLIDLAVGGGSNDNVTVVLAQYVIPRS
ncbi:MAG TPA: protein phosphatase 2C domain-containing protein [Vicinamibacterales bacterium]|jgi:protein phosphatase